MAPKRKPKANSTDDTDDKQDDQAPTWDTNERNLMLFLLKLRRWLPKQHAQFNNFIRYGFIINGKQEVVVFNDNHRTDLQNSRLKPGTFESPCLVGVETESDEAGDEESSEEEEEEIDGSAPLSSRKLKPITATTTPGLAKARDEEFKNAPKALLSFDEQVAETILSTFEDEDTIEEYLNDCQGSARLLLKTLHEQANSISTTDDSNVEARADSLSIP